MENSNHSLFSLSDTTETILQTIYLWTDLPFHGNSMFMFLPWRDQLRSFIRVNMPLKYAKVWLNSCNSNSSSTSQWRSFRKTLICYRSLKKQVKLSHMNASGVRCVKAKLYVHFQDLTQSNGGWFGARPLIQLMIFAEISRTLFNFGSKVFESRAWR